MSPELHVEVVPTGHLAERAAVWVADRIWTAASERGVAHLAVSGGSTPVSLFNCLATMHLPWDRLHVWQVDERVAPDGSPDRNASQLQPLGQAGAHVHLMPVDIHNGNPTPTQGDHDRSAVVIGEGNEALSRAALRYAASFPDRFDVTHLGLGDDGHTASWPPGDSVIRATATVSVVGPFNGLMRMTMTPVVINASRHIMFLVSGLAKVAMLSRLYAADTTIAAVAVRRPGTVVLTDVAAG